MKMMNRCSMLATALLALNIASVASAQEASSSQTAAPAAAQGPLVLEKVRNEFVVTPDYKVTELNGDVGQLAGAYVGGVLEEHLLIGGAGYWLANGSQGTDLRYGGLVVGWQTAPARIRFGARGLVGGGQGTLGVPFDRVVDPRVAAAVRDARTIAAPIVARFGGRTPALVQGSVPTTVRVREEFFVFEPQVNALTRVTDHVAVDLAVGYRMIGMADAIGDRLEGATGSLGLQFGW